MPEKRSGHQDLDRLADELGALVAEQPLDLGVDQDDDAVAVDDDHAVGRGLEQAAEQLGLAVLVVGLAQPMATNGPRSVCVGLSVRSTVVDGAVGVAQLGVTDGDLDVVVHDRRDGDLLERMHRRTAEVLDGVPGHGLVRYADHLAGRLVGEHDRHPRGRRARWRRRTSAPCSRERVVLPPFLVVQHLHVSIRLDRRAPRQPCLPATRDVLTHTTTTGPQERATNGASPD